MTVAAALAFGLIGAGLGAALAALWILRNTEEVEHEDTLS